MMIVDPYRFAVAGGGGGGTPHRYWRVLITANDGDASFIGFTEIQMRATPGGADQTQPQPTSVYAASASSEINNDNAAANAVDDLTTKGWLTANASFPAWFRYDFSFGSAPYVPTGPVDVKEITIAGSFNVPAASPKDFQLQWSDDASTWTTVLTVTGQTGWTGAADVRTFTV